MKILSLLLPLFMLTSDKPYKIDFGTSTNRTTNWVILGDNVMGGLSEAQLKYETTSIIVKGFVSLENRGGFVSIKSTFGKVDLS